MTDDDKIANEKAKEAAEKKKKEKEKEAAESGEEPEGEFKL